jgi:hypothetical protein
MEKHGCWRAASRQQPDRGADFPKLVLASFLAQRLPLSSIPISSIYGRLQDGLPYVMLVWPIRANDAKIGTYHLGALGSSAKPEMNSIMKHQEHLFACLEDTKGAVSPPKI